jgi:type II secretory pathway component PulC
VDACTRELLLQSPSTALNTLRVVPQAKDGQMTGMRLFGIRPTSVWAKLGLRNSDLVIAINGHALSNPTQALEAYSEVKDADRFTVELERAGVTQIRAYFVKKLPAGTDAAKACPELAAATGGESDALAAKPQPSTLSTSPVVRPADKLPPVVTKGIKCQGSKCTITRAALDAVLGDPSMTSRSARLVPTLINGQVAGFKVLAIRPASLFALLGLLNGDLIRRISGFDLNSPERALEAYTKVRNAKTIPLELTRRGAEMTLTYVIGQ